MPERIGELAPRRKSAADSHHLTGSYDAASLLPDDLEAIGEKLLEKARPAVAAYGLSDTEVISTAGMRRARSSITPGTTAQTPFWSAAMVAPRWPSSS